MSMSALLLALLACDRPSPAASPAASAASPRDTCARYRTAAPDAYGLCLARAVVRVDDAAGMEAVCADAGPFSADCHAAWVLQQSRLHRLAPDALLAACGPSYDCALQQLDAHPDADLVVQLRRCAQAGPFEPDCAAHAVQRWANAWPDAAEVDRVRAAAVADPVSLGTFVGMGVACGPAGPGRPSCPPGEDRYALACRHGAAGYAAAPERCGGVLPGG